MSWSLNEVEGLARKAARGSGLSWGLSEEAGKAVRWLTGKGLPGSDLLARLLEQNQGATYETLCPAEVGATWQAADGLLCPMISGAVLCDHAAMLADGKELTLGPVSFPLLLLPFAAGAAQTCDQNIAVSWPGTSATITPDGQLQFSQEDTLTSEREDSVGIALRREAQGAAVSEVTRCDIPQEVSAVLGQMAHRTYAPDTPESRLAGAGAGLTDND